MRKEEWNTLQILSHSRHDWLNVIQLIKGNLALKKYDRIEEIIQEIVHKTQHESKLSNLKIPQFASKALIFNWEQGNHFQLEFEVVGANSSLEKYDAILLNWFQPFINVLNESAEAYGENHLLLTIEVLPEQRPRLLFDFRGKLIKETKLKQFISNKSNWNEQLTLVEFYMNEEEFYLVIQLNGAND